MGLLLIKIENCRCLRFFMFLEFCLTTQMVFLFVSAMVVASDKEPLTVTSILVSCCCLIPVTS